MKVKNDFRSRFKTIARAFDQDSFRVAKQTIEDGGGAGANAVEDRGPLFKGLFEVMMIEPRSLRLVRAMPDR